jgi:hypothetical protein
MAPVIYVITVEKLGGVAGHISLCEQGGPPTQYLYFPRSQPELEPSALNGRPAGL